MTNIRQYNNQKETGRRLLRRNIKKLVHGECGTGPITVTNTRDIKITQKHKKYH